jgi:hypothetical protein
MAMAFAQNTHATRGMITTAPCAIVLRFSEATGRWELATVAEVKAISTLLKVTDQLMACSDTKSKTNFKAATSN